MMLLLPLVDVLFVGLVGTDPGNVQGQLTAIFADQKVVAHKTAAADIKALTHQDASGPGIVKKLASDGVVASEIVVNKGHHSLVIVVYNASGELVSMSETPFAGKKLASAELAMMHDNLDDELNRLVTKSHKVAAKQPATKPAPAPTAPASAPMTSEAPLPESEDDPLSPHKATPVATATADAPDASTTVTAAAPSKPRSFGIHGDLGFGIMTRSFSPGPATATAFDSSPVPSIQLEVIAEPIKNLSVGVDFERTLTMHTAVGSENDSTSITRWEGRAGYALLGGHLRPEVGVGRRVFDLDTTNASATPNADYIYVLVGATASADITPKVSVFGSVAVEPVFGGQDQLDMSLGIASRWAFDVGAGIEVRPAAHLYARAIADYQRFSWSWADADSGASDGYPSAALQLGARY